MTAKVLSILLACLSVGAVIADVEDTLSEGRYCDLAGGLGVCKKQENCAGADAVEVEECSSPLVCCPPPGAKAKQMCDEYSWIETGSSCHEGGDHRAQLGEFPHMAILGYQSVLNNKWICGGVLISERFVLTTAVCSTNDKMGPPRRVRLGDLEIADREVRHVQQVTVEEVIPHPQFDNSGQSNDIALLKLSKDVRFSSIVRPACLYTAAELPARTGVALGWGRGVNHSDKLLKASLPFVSSEECKHVYKGRVDISETATVCAGDSGKNTCAGDSGTPLQVPKNGPGCMSLIVGLSSFGSVKCGDSTPTVYTRVSHFMPWIESVVWA